MDEQAYADEVGPSAGRPLNLRQIEVFRAIMMAGSISGAGRMLHVSQPAVSRVLALTETRLGYRLFERVKSRLSPTAEARRLYAEVEQVYGGIQRVNDLAASLGQSGAGMLKIVASASYGQRLVPMALGRFRDRNADARVDYRSVTFDELAAYFLSGQADIGISMRPPDHPNLASTRLATVPVICAVPKGHPLAAHDVVHPEDFASAAWIGYPHDTPLGRALQSFFGGAPAWQPLAPQSMPGVFYDRDSIVQLTERPLVMLATVAWFYAQPRVSEANGQPYGSVTQPVTLNCSNNTYTITETQHYAGPDATGELVESLPVAGISNAPVARDPVQRQLRSVICPAGKSSRK